MAEKKFFVFIKKEKDEKKQPRQVFQAENDTPLIICK